MTLDVVTQAERELFFSQDFVNSQLQKLQDLPAPKQVGTQDFEKQRSAGARQGSAMCSPLGWE